MNKDEHELLLFNTDNHLLEKQNENPFKDEEQNVKKNIEFLNRIETQNEKLNSIEKKNLELQNKFETQITIIETQDEKLNNIEKKNLELQNKIETQDEKFNSIEKKYFELQNKIETQITIIETQNEKLDGIEKNLESQNKIETQITTTEKHSKKLKQIEEKLEILESEGEKEFDEIEKLMHEESNKTNRSRELVENQLKDVAKQIETLNQFAEDMSKLHLTLSDPLIRLNYPINQKEYEEEKQIKRWYHFTDEISRMRNNIPDYVKNLKKAVASYSLTVYPRDHSDLFMYASLMLSCDNFNVNDLLKLECPCIVHYVSMKVFAEYKEFENELKTKQYMRSSQRVASYCDVNNSTFNVAVHHDSTNIILHYSADENKHLKIPIDGTKVDVKQKPGDGDGFYKFICFIFYFRD